MKRVRQWIAIKRPSGQGQSLVEVALFFPILLILLAGLLEIGLYANHYLTVLDSSREGARMGADGDIDPLLVQPWTHRDTTEENQVLCELGPDELVTRLTDPGHHMYNPASAATVPTDAEVTDFYFKVGCLAYRDLHPLDIPTATVTLNDIVLSVYAIAPLTHTVEIKYRPNISDDIEVLQGMGVSVTHIHDGYYSWLNNFRPDTESLYPNRVTLDDIRDYITANPPSGATAFLLVEVWYEHELLLDIPFTQRFIPNPVLIHTYTLMPISAAEPTPTPGPPPTPPTLNTATPTGASIITFAAANYSVIEGAGAIDITVQLSHASLGDITVDYITLQQTALAGQDYTAVNDTLLFEHGETTKTFSVPILDDTNAELTEEFTVELQNPVGNAVIGAQSWTTVVIFDDDGSSQLNFSSPTYTVNEGDGVATITVELSPPAAGLVTVNYDTSDGTATAGLDYTAVSGLLTFLAGETSQTFDVPIGEDTQYEGDETILLSLSGPSGAALGGTNSATLTILDNDSPPGVMFEDDAPTVAEAGGPKMINVILSRASADTITVNYATSDGTATAVVDYTPASGMLIFAPGQLAQSFPVPITIDVLDEGDETVVLTLSNPTNATITGTNPVELTIVDDDSCEYGPFSLPGRIEAEDFACGGEGLAYHDTDSTNQGGAYRATEGVDVQITTDVGAGFNVGWARLGEWLMYQVDVADTGFYDLVFRVASADTTGRIRLRFDGADITGQLVVPNTGGWQTWTDLTVTGVWLTAGRHLFKLDIEGPDANLNYIDVIAWPDFTDCQYLEQGGQVVIEAEHNVSQTPGTDIFSNSHWIETTSFSGYVGSGAMQAAPPENGYNAYLTTIGPRMDYDVYFQTAGDYYVYVRAWPGDDPSYPSVNDSIHFGLDGVPFTLSGTGYTGWVDNRFHWMKWSAPQSIPTGEHSLNIWMREDGIVVDRLMLSTSSSVIGNYSTVPGPGESSAPAGCSGGALLPAVEFSSATYAVEEDAGPATITVVLDPASGDTVTVGYSSVNGTATAGDDYAATSGILTFPAGVISRTFDVPIVDDRAEEGSETVALVLTGPSNAVLGPTDAAVLTIQDDDITRVADGLLLLYTFYEGSGTAVHDVSGYAPPIDLTVLDGNLVSWPLGRLSIDQPTIVKSGGPATKVTSACKASNEITIEAWVRPANSSQTGPARVVTLSQDPLNRNFTLGQDGSVYNTRLRTTTTGNNGSLRSLTAGSADPTALRHLVYTRNTGGLATFYVDGSPVGSRSDIDGNLSNWDAAYLFALANELSYPTDQRNWLGEYCLVAVYDQALDQAEISRNFEVGCRAPDGSCGQSAWKPPSASQNGDWNNAANAYVNDSNYASADGAPKAVEFWGFGLNLPADAEVQGIEVRLDWNANSTLDDPYLDVYLSWDGGTTWTSAQSTPVLPATTRRTDVVGGAADNWGRTWTPAEMANLRVRVVSRRTGSGATPLYRLYWLPVRVYYCQSGTLPVVDFGQAEFTVGEGAGTAVITVTLDNAWGRPVTVDYATADGTAVVGGDYTAVSGTLSFIPGQTSQIFSIPLLEDALDEEDETITVTLANPSNATIGATSPATVTIADNDPLPVVDFTNSKFNVAEGTSTVTITVALDAVSARTVTVDYATSDGTATAGVDYGAVGGTLTFLAGETSHSFTVPISDDLAIEGDETVVLTLSGPSNASLGANNPASLTIVDDDPIAWDDFESGDGSGGGGWGGNWLLAGNSSSVVNDGRAHGGLYHLMERRIGYSIRAVDLSGVTGAQLQFWWRARSFDSASERGYVEISNDGGVNWSVVLQVDDGQDDDIYHYAEVDLAPAYLVSGFQLRIRIQGNGDWDFFYVDDIAIVGYR